MGSCMSSSSRIEKQELVSRSKARKRYIKQLVQSRQALSLAHSFYLRSLRSTGAALLQFAAGESSLRRKPPPVVPTTPSMSPTTDTWTTTTATWDFWDPFAATSGSWEEDATTSTVVRAAASVAAPPSVVSGVSEEREMAVAVSRQGKEFVEIIKELDEYFVKAGDSGEFVSGVLELPIFSNLPSSNTFLLGSSGKVFNYGRRNLSWRPVLWGSSGKLINGLGFEKLGEEIVVDDINVINNGRSSSHCSTLERLYAWEKKLFLEVKNAEKLKMEHEKRVEELRRMEVKRVDYMKTEKMKKVVEKLESQMEVASQTINTISAEITKVRESQLYPQLLNLVKGFMCMWRGMYECHQVQMHIVDQLKLLNSDIPASTEPTSEIHRQSTLQLETELQKWHRSFCDLVRAHREYIRSLTGWLHLSLFEFDKNPLTRSSMQDCIIYSLCEDWQSVIDRVPDKVASEGIKSLLNVIHTIIVQQAEEHKQEKKLEAANKELEKRAAKLRSLEVKWGPYSMPESGSRNGRSPISEKHAKVEILKAKAEEEKGKYDKVAKVTREMTLNNMEMGLPHVFQAITGFSSVCMHGFESVYNQAKGKDMDDQEKGVKSLTMA